MRSVFLGFTEAALVENFTPISRRPAKCAMRTIVRGVSCVLVGSTEAALMGNFTPISRRPTKGAMRSAWVHSGALRAPLCIQGDVMAHFAGRR